MSEQRPTKISRSVPSNVPNHARRASFPEQSAHPQAGPSHSQQPHPQNLSQPQYQQQQYQQYQQQQQQQQQQQLQQRRMSGHTSGTQPLIINTNQRPQQPQPTHAQQPSTFQSPMQPPTPHSAPVHPDQVLRDKIISLLASTANGCIVELGYPTLVNQHKNLQAEYTKLVEECKSVQAENANLKSNSFRIAELLLAKQKKEEQDAQVIQGLNARIAVLENEHDLLRRQCRVLQESRTLDAPAAYKVLEDKYHYVLNMLKTHNVPLVLPDSKEDGANAEPSLNDAYAQSVIDLTTSPASSPNLNTNQKNLPPNVVSQPDAAHPQIMQTSSDIPPIPTQPGSASPMPIPSVQNVGPSASITSGSPTVHSIPKPVSPTTNGLASAPENANPQPSTGPSEIHQTQAIPTNNTSRGLDMQVGSPSSRAVVSVPSPSEPQLLSDLSDSHSSSTTPRVCASVHASIGRPSTAVMNSRKESPHSISAPAQIDPIPTHAEASSHAQSEAQIQEQQQPMAMDITPEEAVVRPHLHVQTTFDRSTTRTPPTPLTAISKEAAKRAESETQKSRNASPVAAVSGVNQNQEAFQQVASRSPADTSDSVPSSSAKSIPMMDIDGNRRVPERTDAEDPDIVMAEGEALGNKEIPASTAPNEKKPPAESQSDEGEEEDEIWDDLTDDEDGKKVPVFDCISSIFYDDENDERLCNFCKWRLEKQNLPGLGPTFTECSMRELITHAKDEHALAWETFRRGQTGPS